MNTLIYFLTVVLPGAILLGSAAVYDHTHVPTGENFMPKIADLKDFI